MYEFSEAIRHAVTEVRIVAEIKCRSPRDGDLLAGRDPVEIARGYARAGAVALSYVTTAESFGGHLDVLRWICDSVDLPVLRKDFIRSNSDVERSAELGAAAVLLIASHLDDDTLAGLVDACHRAGLDSVVEIHGVTDIERAAASGATVVGINNRDIDKLELDSGSVAVTEELAGLIPNTVLKLSMSAVGTAADVRRALGVADAVLIGTALMSTPSPEMELRSLLSRGNS